MDNTKQEKDDILQSVGYKIQEYRVAAKLTQAQLAELTSFANIRAGR